MLQVASGRVCSGEMMQRLENALKASNALIDDLNCHFAHALRSVQDIFPLFCFSLEGASIRSLGRMF